MEEMRWLRDELGRSADGFEWAIRQVPLERLELTPPAGLAAEPVMRITPRDLAVLIDRLQVPFGRPAQIGEGRGFAATDTSEVLPIDALQRIVELTRGLGTPLPEHISGLPTSGRTARTSPRGPARRTEAGKSGQIGPFSYQVRFGRPE